MAFKLKSGNKPSFKNMGSSPVKQITAGTIPPRQPSPPTITNAMGSSVGSVASAFPQKSPAKQTTDREAMREAARKKNIENNEKMREVLAREGEYAPGPSEYKEVHGTYTKPGGLPKMPNEGNVAHTLRKAATWIGVGNEKAKKRSKKLRETENFLGVSR